MKFFLKSPYSCLIKTDSQAEELDDGDTLEIEDEPYLFVYPMVPEILPFSINLNFPKENAYFSVLNHNNLQIILLEQPLRLKVTQKEKLTFVGDTCEVCVQADSISFETSQRKIEYACPHKLQNAKIFKLNNFACVQCDQHLYAYSVSKNKLSHFNGEITLEAENLLLVKNFHDSDNRTRKAKYILKEDITMESEEFSCNTQPYTEELVPYKLLERVKAKDFSKAHELLSDSLQSQIDSNQIREFFGNFSNFLPLSTTEFIIIGDSKKQYVTFSLHNGKVDDISVDVL